MGPIPKKPEDKVTPRPWRVEHHLPYEADITDMDGNPIKGIRMSLDDAPVPDYNSVVEANAAHIVKCVNMHEQLVEALRKWVSYLETKRFESKTFDNLLELSRPLLAKAGGE